MDAAVAGAPSVAHLDAPPRVLQAGAGEVAAVGRRPNGPGEGRPWPRISAEAKEAWADNPGDWRGRVGGRLGLGCARSGEDADRENGRGERVCNLLHVEAPPQSRPAEIFERPSGGYLFR